jgi:hypothetical protein
MTASGIYQVIARRGRQCGIEAFPHRFRRHFIHTCLDHGGAEGWPEAASTAIPPGELCPAGLAQVQSWLEAYLRWSDHQLNAG